MKPTAAEMKLNAAERKARFANKPASYILTVSGGAYGKNFCYGEYTRKHDALGDGIFMESKGEIDDFKIAPVYAAL